MSSSSPLESTPLPYISAAFSGFLESLKVAAQENPTANIVFTSMDVAFNVALTAVDAAATGKYLTSFESAIAGSAGFSWAASYLGDLGWGALSRGLGTTVAGIAVSKLVEFEGNYLQANESNIITALVQQPGNAPLTYSQVGQAITSVIKNSITNTYNEIVATYTSYAAQFDQPVINTPTQSAAFNQSDAGLANQIDGDVIQQLDNAISSLGPSIAGMQWRWTDGDAGLALSHGRILEIEVAITERYWLEQGESAAPAAAQTARAVIEHHTAQPAPAEARAA